MYTSSFSKPYRLLAVLLIGTFVLLFGQYAFAQQSEAAHLESLGLGQFETYDAFFSEIQNANGINLTETEQQQLLSAIENDPSLAQQVTLPRGPSLPPTPETINTVNCFDHYTFGSVYPAIDTNVQSSVTGTTMTFNVDILNNNPYPVTDGVLYIKIFRQQEIEDNTYTQANHVVDQWRALENVTLAAGANQTHKITWEVPEYIGTDTYYAATYFATNDRYNLSGLSFTDDIIGGSSGEFSIKGELDTIYLDKNNVTLNGEPYRFIGPPLQMPESGEVVVEFPVVNKSTIDHLATIEWTISKWDNLLEEHVLDTHTETINVPANDSAIVSRIVTADGYPVIMVEPRMQINNETVSALNIRFIRANTDVPRINFPSISNYPLKANETNSLFSCLHNAGQAAAVDNGELTLTLTDSKGNQIHTYTYTGLITGAMMGVKDDFTLNQDIANFSLNAVLKVDGEVLEDVTITYDCNEIDPTLCPKEVVDNNQSSTGSNNIWWASVLIVVILLGIVVVTMKRRNRLDDDLLSDEEDDVNNQSL